MAALHPVPEEFLPSEADWQGTVAVPRAGPEGPLVVASCHSEHGCPLRRGSVGPFGER